MYSARYRWAWSVGLVLLCFTLAGCHSSKGRAKVKGKVKFFDKTLTAGTVSFHGKDGQVGTGNIDFQGNYEVGNAPLGDVTITVSVPQAMRGPTRGGPSPKPPPGVPEMRPPGEAGASSTPAIDLSKIVQIPGKYASPESSGLKYTVESGEQTHDITLSP